MPNINVNNQVTAANALDGLQFQDLLGPALITIAASAVTVTDVMSYSIGPDQFLVASNMNIEASADVVDTHRDIILRNEPVPAGKQFMPVTATTAIGFRLFIEEV